MFRGSSKLKGRLVVGTALSVLLSIAISAPAQPVDEPTAPSLVSDYTVHRFIDVTEYDGILLQAIPESIRVKNQSKAGRTWLVQVGKAKTNPKPNDACSEEDAFFPCLAVGVALSILGLIAFLKHMIAYREFNLGSIGLLLTLLAIVIGGLFYYFTYYRGYRVKPVNICFDNASNEKYDVLVDGNYLLTIEPMSHSRKYIYKEFPVTAEDPEATLEIKIVTAESETEGSEKEWVRVKVKPAYPNRYLYNIGKQNTYSRHSVAYGGN